MLSTYSTPGTGKTTHASQLIEALQALEIPAASSSSAETPAWETINVSEFVKANDCHSGYNEEWDTYDVDEDKLLDDLEIVQRKGGRILDWHTCDIFPERWIDFVVVLRCEHSTLWTRLEKRGPRLQEGMARQEHLTSKFAPSRSGYTLNKIQENNEAEIMQVVLQDARESYAEEIVVELTSEGPEDVEQNVARIAAWIKAWLDDHPDGVDA
ncbi:BZ3500_MvSof-1268-A1-R1_Chr1-3g02384 [Microbotryum saponariae]|uniref:BZ3500_MvSof-1268-A1-R1_Chr1-3g02384 protein n=1 Tax=Microbotryum saponariae TaxID=289078 RepID=A0A2X0LB62_9BASI|nr:BZ3500_MvSof-1268-A1-R1_Chr1-3g02384 [Microbotryum saponariae]SCZ96171.1 BZ3501_MvSof-1269-A2-R1_Chr1-3g01987 [Microbotryum saponariae]